MLKWQLVGKLLLIGACVIEANLPAFLPCPGYDDFSFWILTRKCYTSSLLPLGCECFDISENSDFRNSYYLLPSSPSSLNDIRFLLYTDSNKDTPQIIASNDASIQNSNFDANKPTKFITHGFRDKAPKDWSVLMKDELLKLANMNVILVNWEKGAGILTYFKPVANVRLVGAIMGQLIHVMKHGYGVDVNNIHLIGHSLGAHVSGTAAKEFRRLNNGERIWRVTGLDPAGLRFEDFSPNVRLDKTDAQFVDVIHTDAESIPQGGFGTRYAIGDVDFWPNGGKDQPGCSDETLGIASIVTNGLEVGCDHLKALTFFTKSINQCLYLPPNGNPQCRMGVHCQNTCTGDVSPTTTADDC